MIDLSILGGYSSGSGNKLQQLTTTSSANIILEDIEPQLAVNMLNREYEVPDQRVNSRRGRISDTQTLPQPRIPPDQSILSVQYSFMKAKDLKYHTGDNFRSIQYGNRLFILAVIHQYN
ncbi:hypothetical protein MASR2M69_18490 [Bacteroidota bacterium]